MLQNQTFPKVGNFPQPLLMNFTVPTKIQESIDEIPKYDDLNQIIYDMRVMGTKSLKSSTTQGGNPSPHIDRKNEIDDSKIVR